MMRYLVMLLLCSPAFGADISYFDSTVNPKKSWVLVDDCAVEIPRNKVKDVCYVLHRVNDFCKLDLNLEKCRD